MGKYIAKRIVQSILSICIVVFVVFMLLRLMPTEGYFTRADYENMSEAQREMYLEEIGVTGNPIVRFGEFIGQLLKGNLGESYILQPNVEVSTILAEKIPYSLAFGTISMVISLILGLLLGMLMARYKDKLMDWIGTGYIVIVRAVPSLIYLYLAQIFITDLFNIPMMFNERNPVTFVMPVLSLASASVAWYAIWLRRFMVDERNKDYVKFAVAKGVSPKDVSKKHIFRNALVPLVQYFPMQMLLTVAGSLIIESLYSVPGMGGLLVDAIKEMDNSLVQILVMLFSILGVLGVLLGDILMAIVDPRIKLAKVEEEN